MTTLEERVARLEGSYEHLASRAELAELKLEIVRLESRLSSVEAQLTLVTQQLVLIAQTINAPVVRPLGFVSPGED